ncbi:hypothetical protein TRIUR3_05845 [Triticum urartu]|uniref:Uncharacterized protein n=1 Tax=Triticum urartu TaxID=4572 RepID=M7YLY4_TRIUA|nr:hypothetical protein TRIUR3_05845 [Triticum urartu]
MENQVEGSPHWPPCGKPASSRTRRCDSVQRDMVFITGEFQMMQAFIKAERVENPWMQSFLKVDNGECMENPVVISLVRQIRELAYDMEDSIKFVV